MFFQFHGISYSPSWARLGSEDGPGLDQMSQVLAHMALNRGLRITKIIDSGFCGRQHWSQTCKWYVFAGIAKNQYLTELVLAMITPKPKLSQGHCFMVCIWHQTQNNDVFKNAIKLASRHIGLRHGLDNFQNCTLSCLFLTALCPDLQMTGFGMTC